MPQNPTKTKGKKQAFLALFTQIATVTGAAKAAGINALTHYRWLRDDPTYAEGFEMARQEAAQRLEREALRRAFDGVERPVYQGGRQVGTIREYSDTLLIFLLKGMMPEKYGYRLRHEVSGPAAGGIKVQFVAPDGWVQQAAEPLPAASSFSVTGDENDP